MRNIEMWERNHLFFCQENYLGEELFRFLGLPVKESDYLSSVALSSMHHFCMDSLQWSVSSSWRKSDLNQLFCIHLQLLPITSQTVTSIIPGRIIHSERQIYNKQADNTALMKFITRCSLEFYNQKLEVVNCWYDRRLTRFTETIYYDSRIFLSGP